MQHITMLRRCGGLSLRASVGIDPAKLETNDYVRLTLPTGHDLELTRNEARTLCHMLGRLLEVPLQHIEADLQAPEAVAR